MKRLLVCSVVALLGLTIVVETSDAGLFRRGRRSNSCQPCNACQMQGGPQSQQYGPGNPNMNPNMNAPPPPNAPQANQPMNQGARGNINAQGNAGNPNVQGNTTFNQNTPNAPQAAPQFNQQPANQSPNATAQGQGNQSTQR
jgi:hypothetical protein